MLKHIFSVRLDDKLVAEAQRLVDAGEFDSLAQMLESALRDFLQNFDAAPSGAGQEGLLSAGAADGDGVQRLPPAGASGRASSAEAQGAALEARILRGLTETFSQAERDGYERLVMSYSALAEHPLQDGEMRELAEISRTYALEETLHALDEAQNSRLPLSPSYLEMLLERRRHAMTPAAQGGGAPAHGWYGPERVPADFNNPLAAAVAKLYEKEIGLLTERVKEQIATYIVEFPDLEKWDEAFAAAAGMNKRSFRYVLGVLRGNATKVVEQKGRDNRGLSKSERVRTEKRKQSSDYFQRWEEKRKAKHPSDPGE